MKDKEKMKAAIEQVRTEEELKERTREYLYEKVYARKKKRKSPPRHFSADGSRAPMVCLVWGQ